MKAVEEAIINKLISDPVLTAIVPAANILFGPVDVPVEKQGDLIYPQINIYQISEVQRTVPLGVRDIRIQISIFSRNFQTEVENIYERIITLLAFKTIPLTGATLFWSRLEGAVDNYESGARIWHRAADFAWWAKDGQYSGIAGGGSNQ